MDNPNTNNKHKPNQSKNSTNNSKGGEARDKRKQIKHKAQQAAIEAAMEMRSGSHSIGSYTGTAHDGDIPEQDADDL